MNSFSSQRDEIGWKLYVAAVDNKSAIVPGLSMRSSRDIYYSKKTLLRISANTVPEIDLALGQQRTKHSVSLNIALVIEDSRR